MAKDLRRVTISITPGMGVDINRVKKEQYCKESESDMLRDLIVRGLASLQSETGKFGNPQKQSTQLHKSVYFPKKPHTFLENSNIFPNTNRKEMN